MRKLFAMEEVNLYNYFWKGRRYLKSKVRIYYMGWIYKITSPVGKSYIGQTWKSNAYIRWTKHKNEKASKCRAVRNAIIYHGAENMLFEPLYEISYKTHGYRWKEFLDFWEKYEIAEEDTLSPNGYNLHPGGKNHAMSEESKQILREKATGKKATKETKAKMSISHTGERNHFFGMKHSKQALEKMSLAKKGKPSGRTVTDEQKLKAKNTREKNTDKHKYLSGAKHPHSVSVDKFTLDGEFIESFESILQAAQSIGVGDVGIRNCLKGKGKQSGGFIWKRSPTTQP